MGTKIRYGLVGYGPMGNGNARLLKSVPKLSGRTDLIGAFDPVEANQQRIKKNNLQVATEFDQILDMDLDALLIASPPQFHADQVVAGLESGHHVFSEVPMVIKENDIERIIEAEEKSGKKYQFGENYVFHSPVLYSAYLASSGKIGPTVYAESEYLHDVTYRWRQNSQGDHTTPRIESWYSLFDPLAYAHSIGPAQVALGGLKTPMPFTEVKSYANSIGGFEGKAICAPSEAFHVALFQTDTGAVAKCANAYIFAREPTRLTIQVIGRNGTYECYNFGKPGRLFLAEGHIVTARKKRKGKTVRITRRKMAKILPSSIPFVNSHVGILDDWLSAIEKDALPVLNAKVAANMTMAGIAASKSARGNTTIKIPVYNAKQ